MKYGLRKRTPQVVHRGRWVHRNRTPTVMIGGARYSIRPVNTRPPMKTRPIRLPIAMAGSGLSKGPAPVLPVKRRLRR